MGDEDSTNGGHASADKDTEGMSEVQLLRACLREQTKVAEANANALAKLSEAMRGLAPSPIVPPTPEEARNGKFEKL